MLSLLRRSTLSLMLSATLLTGGSVCAFAQSQSINGTIRGRATDSTGASIPDATVTVNNTDVGYARTVATEGDGLFVLLNLPLGTYKITVAKTGFSSVNYQSIVLNAGKELTLDPVLTIGATTTEIEVTAESGGIDPSTLNLERTLDAREVQNLPLTSRNPYNFILFQPGVSGHPNPELGIPRTINTNGLLDRINYQMDGMVNTESDRIGLRLFPIGEIFVKEVQTVSDSFAPEFGWTSGNVYNVISNNGTNSLHGKFQYIQRWQDATAYPYFANKSLAKTNIEMEDVEANLGGRIIKDKLFFFGAYEKITRGSPAAVTITPANIAALGLTATDVAAAPGLLHGTFVLGRGDWNINRKNSLFVRYNYFKNDFPFNTQVGVLNTRSTGVDFLDRAHAIGAQLITTVNDHMINELRFSWPFRNNSHFAPPGRAAGPAVVISGIANLGASSNGGDQYNDKVPSGSENLSYVRGTHTLKFGFNVSKILNRQRALSFNTYTFSGANALQNYLDAKNGVNTHSYATFISQTDALGLGYSSQFIGFYAQDTWQATRSLTLIYGLRYDRFKSPNANPNAPFVNSQKFNTPNTDLSPRVGLSYRLGEKMVVKTSVGMFYQAPPTNLWFNALNLDGSNRVSAYTYGPTTGPAFPAIPSNTGTPAAQNVTTVSPGFKNEYTWNATLQLQQEFGRHDSMTVGYILANGRNMEYLHNINPINPTGTLADGRPVFSSVASAATRLDTRFNQINQVESGANTSFNALIFNYTHSLVRGIQLNANYTWSHSISDAPDVNTFEQSLAIEDTTNRKRDRANSIVNHPHALNMTAVVEPTFSLSNHFANEVANHNLMAVLANVMSGDQASVFTGSSINGDSSVTGVTRPLFVGRDSVRSPNVYQFDGRYTRTFPKLFDRLSTSVFLEANNIFNHTNVTGIATVQPVSSTGAPSGAPSVTRSSVLEARIVQWGVAARW